MSDFKEPEEEHEEQIYENLWGFLSFVERKAQQLVNTNHFVETKQKYRQTDTQTDRGYDQKSSTDLSSQESHQQLHQAPAELASKLKERKQND